MVQAQVRIEEITAHPIDDVLWNKQISAANIKERHLEVLLQWVKSTFNPNLVLYPFCGWHITPR